MSTFKCPGGGEMTPPNPLSPHDYAYYNSRSVAATATSSTDLLSTKEIKKLIKEFAKGRRELRVSINNLVLTLRLRGIRVKRVGDNGLQFFDWAEMSMAKVWIDSLTWIDIYEPEVT